MGTRRSSKGEILREKTTGSGLGEGN